MSTIGAKIPEEGGGDGGMFLTASRGSAVLAPAIIAVVSAVARSSCPAISGNARFADYSANNVTVTAYLATGPRN